MDNLELSAFHHQKKMLTNVFSEYYTDNMKMLPAFEKQKSGQHFLQRMIRTT